MHTCYRKLTRLFIQGLLLAPPTVNAHVSDQGLVLLLPTNIYIGTGVFTVVITIFLLAVMPASWTRKLLSTRSVSRIRDSENRQRGTVPVTSAVLTSTISCLCLFAMLALGLAGTNDPLENALPLFIWTIWWIGFVILHGVFGNLWCWTNPWHGPYQLIQFKLKKPSLFQLPTVFGQWPAVVALLCFITFALADIAPDAPTRLAVVVSLYWIFTLMAMLLFGEEWLQRGECFTLLFTRYAQLAPISLSGVQLRFGLPGWRTVLQPATSISGAVFILVLLGTGSFDGFNETFLWLSWNDINPLEFPGRSAVVGKTVIGLLIANVALVCIYTVCIFSGTLWANRQNDNGSAVSFKTAFCQLAIAMLPIAFVYHFAHFLTAFMVNIQYAVATATDPLDIGADLLSLGTFYVTTGFMNSHHTVEAIWLSQATAVVLGHVLSVLIAHGIALNLFTSARRAIISQAPLAAFMILYTFIGLWLLAAPRGA